MIPQDFIDELLAKTDIVDIIGQSVPLKKSGANYMACCPFHKEKSPSFSVSPNKQFYHCFGCGAHGSAIGFIMEYQGLSFTEAVRYLADRHGLAVPQTHGRAADADGQARAERKKHQENLQHTLQTAAAFYQAQLARTPQAQAYLQQRGLNADIIARFGIGYAPAGWQPLAAAFADYPNARLAESGLVIEKEGKHYDRFRQRIMFPIRDGGGKIIGFGGRVLGDGQPKYLNSPETPLFQKGKNLYGLHEARHAVRESGRVLVVEGYLDVIALAQAGIGYAVATSGTAATADHLKMLMRQSQTVYFCFDGDAAGRKAAWRALETALPQLQDGKSLHFLLLPENHDPDSYVREYGKTSFENLLLQQSRPLSAYFWDVLAARCRPHTAEGKAELVQTAAPLLRQITQAPALAYLLAQNLAEKTGIAPADLAKLTGQRPPANAAPRGHGPRLPPQNFRQPAMLGLVHKQIRSLLLHPEWAQYAVFPDYLPVSGDYACLDALADYYRRHPHSLFAQTAEHFRNSPFAAAIETVLPHLNAADADTAESFQDGMARLRRELAQQQINYLKQKNVSAGLNAAEKQLLLQLLQAA